MEVVICFAMFYFINLDFILYLYVCYYLCLCYDVFRIYLFCYLCLGVMMV